MRRKFSSKFTSASRLASIKKCSRKSRKRPYKIPKFIVAYKISQPYVFDGEN